MEIIRIRPELVKKIGEELVAELSKGIPEERMASIHEMAEIACQIKDRAEDAKAIPLKMVEQFNSMCYKLFSEEQDGAEFEKMEALKVENPASRFDFGRAIQKLKDGEKVSRDGWNGKKQYIILAENITFDTVSGNDMHVMHDSIGTKSIAFVGTSGIQMGWLASQADMLAEDWHIAEV